MRPGGVFQAVQMTFMIGGPGWLAIEIAPEGLKPQIRLRGWSVF